MISLGTIKTWLGISGEGEDAALQLLERQAVALLERETRQVWLVPAILRTDRRTLPPIERGLFTGGPTHIEFYLDKEPAGDVLIEERISPADWWDISAEAYIDGNVVELPSRFAGTTVRATYSHGYATEADLPPAVSSTVLALVRWLYDERARGGITVHAAGNGIRTEFSEAMPVAIRLALNALAAPPAVA